MLVQFCSMCGFVGSAAPKSTREYLASIPAASRASVMFWTSSLTVSISPLMLPEVSMAKITSAIVVVSLVKLKDSISGLFQSSPTLSYISKSSWVRLPPRPSAVSTKTLVYTFGNPLESTLSTFMLGCCACVGSGTVVQFPSSSGQPANTGSGSGAFICVAISSTSNVMLSPCAQFVVSFNMW